MKFVFTSLLIVLTFSDCVPAKKYKELLAREEACNEELSEFKAKALKFEDLAKNLQIEVDLLRKEVAQLIEDTTDMGARFRQLEANYDKVVAQSSILENQYDRLRLNGAKETASLQNDLEAKTIELQHKSDALMELEAELLKKESLLAEREARVNELEEIIKRQEEAANALRERVANALKIYEGKGLSVVQKDGKIYVNLEAKLLFKSGSTKVENEGKQALVDLATVLETEEDLEIIVEGHTDTDRLSSASHPKNNWELSVLRATSVVEIMLGNSLMDPKRIVASGRSEFIPVDPKEKAKNRRIEIIISPNLKELFSIIAEDSKAVSSDKL